MQTVVVASATTLDPSPFLFVGLNSASGNYTVTLPPADAWESQLLMIKLVHGTHTVTINAQGTDTIESATALSTVGDKVILITDGVSEWYKF